MILSRIKRAVSNETGASTLEIIVWMFVMVFIAGLLFVFRDKIDSFISSATGKSIDQMGVMIIGIALSIPALAVIFGKSVHDAKRNEAKSSEHHATVNSSTIRPANDWLSKELRAETAAQDNISEMLGMKREHHEDCEAERLRREHMSDCETRKLKYSHVHGQE